MQANERFIPGMIAVFSSGARVAISYEQHEAKPGCFSGLMLSSGERSELWDRKQVARIELGTIEDQRGCPFELPLRCRTPLERRSPSFYDATGRWNRKYLRVCAVYRLLRTGIIDKARALELLAQRHSPKEMQTLRGTVDLWLSGPLAKRAA